MNLLVRTLVPPRSITSAVRAQISALDPDQPVADIQTVDDLVNSSLTQPRFTMLLLGIFAATALVLSVVGIYSVLSYWVAQRRYELGIRLALGAQRADILRIVVRRGLMLAIAGIAIGLFAALLLTRLMSAMLYKVDALDLATFAFAPLLFLFIALLASYLPARGATRVDPMEALRGN
jgi:ABC-type antimicrobial peptide transport system permease subunit